MVCVASLKVISRHAQKLTYDLRTGVLCIILCFALGIANIFHFDIIILWSVLLLSVTPPALGKLSLSRVLLLTPPQRLRPHPHLHRNPSPTPRLPDLTTLRRLHPTLRDKLHACCDLRRHEHRTMAFAYPLRHELDCGGGSAAYRCGVLCAGGAEEAGVCCE
jgi:hypothetical protein